MNVLAQRSAGCSKKYLLHSTTAFLSFFFGNTYYNFKLNHTLFTISHKEIVNTMLMSFFGALDSGPLVGGDEVVEHHQQEQGHPQEVGEQSQLDVRNHD